MKKSDFKSVDIKHSAVNKLVRSERKKLEIENIKRQLAIKFLEKKIPERKHNGFRVVESKTFIISDYKLKS